jgi:hypothetical protein
MAALVGEFPVMASTSVGKAGGAAIGEKLLACVAEHGSAAHSYPASTALLKGPHAARNLSDAVHFLCTLHGRHPGIVDHAANRCPEPAARAWFAAATQAFAAERAFLARLAVAAGPVPGTPGSADSEGAVIGQRHAIEMLAQSERSGCALGAALAVAIDWARIRSVLDAAARRFGVDAPAFTLAAPSDLSGLAATASAERALLFGAEQIVLQHHGLWELLEARQQARGDS